MKKTHSIRVEELSDFINSYDITFARSDREGKRLIIDLTGNLIVFVGYEMLYKGKDILYAVTVYNNATEKYINKSKDFKI